MQSSFAEALQRASPDFQKDAEGYGIDKAGEANLNICGHAIGERFKCLSFTLEMPFKDTEHCPDDFQGWSVAQPCSAAQNNTAAVRISATIQAHSLGDTMTSTMLQVS